MVVSPNIRTPELLDQDANDAGEEDKVHLETVYTTNQSPWKYAYTCLEHTIMETPIGPLITQLGMGFSFLSQHLRGRTETQSAERIPASLEQGINTARV